MVVCVAFLRVPQFGPLFIVPELSEQLESRMRSFENCIWLIGVSRYDTTTEELSRRMTKSAPGVKPVILVAYHAPEDMVAALTAGACGFLCQDTSAEQLLKALGTDSARPSSFAP